MQVQIRLDDCGGTTRLQGLLPNIIGLVAAVVTAVIFLGCQQRSPNATYSSSASADDTRERPAGRLLDIVGSSKPLNNPFRSDLVANESDVDVAALEPEETLLDATRQQEIWDAEHVTHMIEWRLGKKLREALFDRASSDVRRFFADDLQGVVLDIKGGRVRSLANVTERFGDRGQLEQQDADADSLVRWLTNLVVDFDSVAASSMRVLFIDRLEPGGSEIDGEDWAVRVLLSCRGTRDDGTLLEMKSEHTLRVRWENDDDLYDGSVITEWIGESFAFRRCAEPLMREVTEEVGLADLPLPDNWRENSTNMTSMQVAVEDVDRDGFLDIVVATNQGQQLLLRSQGGKRFSPVTKFTPKSRNKYEIDFSTAVLDFNRDGFPDVLIGRRLYRNHKGRGFQDVTDKAKLKFADSQSMGYSIVDFDLDGNQDIYCNYSLEFDRKVSRRPGWIGDDDSGAENQLWRNRGDGTFEEVAEVTKVTGGKCQTFASVWLHANEDRYPDLYLANDFSRNSLLLNRGDGTFEDHSEVSRTADFATSMGATAGDFDNDGVVELYVANMYSKMGRRIVGQVAADDYPRGVFAHIVGACGGNRFYRRLPNETEYRETSMELGINDIGWAYGPVTFDCDNDGNLDLYATTGFLSFDRTKPDG